jgi:DNA-directed RNA polymerase I and III subunit RPAC1
MVSSIKPSKKELDRRKVIPPFKYIRRQKTDIDQIVGINEETVTNVTSTDFPSHYVGEDNSWSVQAFRQSLDIRFHHNAPLDASFSLIGVDASVANAFRRIMIAEIPTLAFEYVFVNNNTSVIQDEVLAHRIGLIPLKGGKKGLLEFMKWYEKPTEEEIAAGTQKAFDHNMAQFELKVECTSNENAARGETDPARAYHDAHVYAHQISFIPAGRQAEYFSGDNILQPANPDILIAKLRPGQCIDLDLQAIKGLGSDHAKFSPVATASYRLLPTIDILSPIPDKDITKFQDCFPEGVVEIKKITKGDAEKQGGLYEGMAPGKNKAVIVAPEKDTVSREVLRHKEFEGKVKLGRRRDHFIFSVESTGQWDSDELFLESVKVLKTKCQKLKKNLDSMIR